MNSHSRQHGRRALIFFVALLLVVLGQGGTPFGLYALSACCVFTLATAAGGWDAAELLFSGFDVGSLEDSAKSKRD